MNGAARPLSLTTAPFLRGVLSTKRVMLEVLLTLLVVVAAATWFFGLSALLMVAACTAGAAGTEWVLATEHRGLGSLRDGSAVLTGVLLALTLPPAMPLWMGFLGGFVSIGLGKLIWGGLGHNLFNPALVGRAFLQAAFPTVITTWTPPSQGFWATRASTFAPPLLHVDAVSSASPLGLAKFQHQVTDWHPLLFGHTAGSLGETSALILVLCGLYLAARRIFDWRLPVSTLLAVAAFTALLHVIDPTRYPTPQFMLLSGGLMFAAVYMVTDPVTTPMTPKGAWIFGIGVGALVVLIRIFGGLPEGVMYAILLMNAVTPLIDRVTQPKPFGG